MPVYNKKYWSEGEYTTASGNAYSGYVGISDNQAYVYDSGTKLSNNSNFLTEFNTSGLHFDRLLQYWLQLPNNKKVIQFQANDFLYSGTIKSILYKLQENNNYIYKNAVIANTLIPNTEYCSILATEDNSKYLFVNKNDKDDTHEAFNTDMLKLGEDESILPIEEQPYFIENPQYDSQYDELREEFGSIAYPEYFIPSDGALPLSQYASLYVYIPNTKLDVRLINGNIKNYDLSQKRTTRTALDDTFYYQNDPLNPNLYSLFYSTNENYRQEYSLWPFGLYTADSNFDEEIYLAKEDEIKSYYTLNKEYKTSHLYAPFVPEGKPEGMTDAEWAFEHYYGTGAVKYDNYKYLPCVKGFYNKDTESFVYKYYAVAANYEPSEYYTETVAEHHTDYCWLNEDYYEIAYKVKDEDDDDTKVEKEHKLKIARFKYEYQPVLPRQTAKSIADAAAVKVDPKYKYIPLTKHIKPPFDFDDIVQTEVRVTDVKYVEGYGKKVSLILFILFSDKLVLINYHYYVDTLTANSTLNNIDFNAAYTRILDDTNANYGRVKYNRTDSILVLDAVDPDAGNSLKFIGLKDMEIHNNYLYMVDSELNMVLRYDIAYLLNDDTEAAWNLKSIRLLDMLQGEGTAKDQIYFNKPCSIAASDDYIYVADGGNRCIKVFSESFDFHTFYKTSYFSKHNLQSVAVNPYKVNIAGKEIPENSVWVFSTTRNNLFVTVLSEGVQVYYSQIDKLQLLEDSYTWDEEFKSVKFSFCESNYYYICTTKRVYKLHINKPAFPYASLSYFKQRISLTSMVWSRSYWQWHALPCGEGDDDVNITWSYRPPSSAAEILDNRGLAVTGVDSTEFIEGTDKEKQFNGDVIFHIGTLYDQSKVDTYIKREGVKFNEIPREELSKMIKASGIFLYCEKTSYISSLTHLELPCYIDSEISNIAPSEYVNPLTFNKIVYKVVYNLINLKNSIIGNFQGGYNIDNIMIYDSIILDDYFQNLSIENIEDFFIHENEPTSIMINRIFERIWELQQRLINHMQTTYVAQPSFTNNSFRII